MLFMEGESGVAVIAADYPGHNTVDKPEK